MSEYFHPGPHPDADQLNAFMEGVLPEHERLESIAHLAECSRCRQLVFLAQEPEPVVAAKAASAWRNRFAPVPIFSIALVGALMVALSIYVHRTPKPPVAVEVSRNEPLPIPEQPLPKRQEVPPAPHEEVATRPVAGTSSLRGEGLSAPAKSAAASSVQAFDQTADAVAANDLRAKAGAGSGSGVAVAAAPAAPIIGGSSEQIVDNAQIQQLPLNGRNVARMAGLSSGPMRLRIEHNRGPADGKSEVSGSVSDATGAIIAGAAVVLHSVTGTARNVAKTDAAGKFALAALPAGQYQLQIAAPGFATLSQRIDLQPRDLALLSPVLNVGSSSETVSVSSESAAMATMSPAPTGLVKAAPSLPSKLPTVTIVSSGGRTLALDSESHLFLSRDGGERWEAVKAQWKGAVSQLALLAPADSPAVAQEETKKARYTARAVSSAFQLTTVAHVVWVSDDGIHWRLQK